MAAVPGLDRLRLLSVINERQLSVGEQTAALFATQQGRLTLFIAGSIKIPASPEFTESALVHIKQQEVDCRVR